MPVDLLAAKILPELALGIREALSKLARSLDAHWLPPRAANVSTS
jgi:hypothetical protein